MIDKSKDYEILYNKYSHLFNHLHVPVGNFIKLKPGYFNLIEEFLILFAKQRKIDEFIILCHTHNVWLLHGIIINIININNIYCHHDLIYKFSIKSNVTCECCGNKGDVIELKKRYYCLCEDCKFLYKMDYRV